MTHPGHDSCNGGSVPGMTLLFKHHQLPCSLPVVTRLVGISPRLTGAIAIRMATTPPP